MAVSAIRRSIRRWKHSSRISTSISILKTTFYFHARSSWRPTTSLMRNSIDLLELHKQLDELFLEHQRALLRLDMHRAAALLGSYKTKLLDHIRDEEELMMPLY